MLAAGTGNADTRHRGRRRNHAGSVSRPSLLLPKPLRWYVDWVRANEENAQSLERLSRTFAMILSDPSNLINMEGCWTISKLHSLSNRVILQTGCRSVSASEALTHILGAIQEVESLGELLLRKYFSQQTTWSVLLALQSIKTVLNACVHQQLFLMPWVWHSVRLYLRRMLRVFRLPNLLLPHRPNTPEKKDGHDGGPHEASNRVYGQTIGPNGTRLVIPRVVSNGRSGHRHSFRPGQQESTTDDAEELEAEESAGAIPFTFIDILGMVIDAFLLVRPVLVLAAARHTFPEVGGEGIAKIPSLPPKQSKKDSNSNSNSTGAEKTAAAAAAAPAEPPSPPPPPPAPAPAPAKPMTKEEKQKAAEEAALGRFPLLRSVMEASTAQQTLFSSWKWWSIFAALDALVVLVSRYIQAYRIPVVYIDEPSASQALRRLESSGGSSGAEEEESDPAAAAAAAQLRNGGEEDGGAEDAANGPPARAVVSNAPAVVSRDSLRLQQAMRNVGYTFLRDPFFTIVLKQLIHNHFIKGFLSRIPIIGSLVGFQVGYFLAMQHYSFLYMLGQ